MNKEDNRNEFVIGIIGGMGSYATLSFFERILKKFPAEKEWERPRVIIDNRCTMPSRVRALLYNENKEKLISELTESLSYLNNVTNAYMKIVLACNTSHVFLNQIVSENPKLGENVIHLIDETAKYIAVQREQINTPFLIATEGTIDSKIYQDTFKKYGISVKVPNEEIYSKMRFFIELVKQNKVTKEANKQFAEFLNSLNEKVVILGCTEFSALYNKMTIKCNNIKIIDPVEVVLNLLYKQFKDYQ